MPGTEGTGRIVNDGSGRWRTTGGEFWRVSLEITDSAGNYPLTVCNENSDTRAWVTRYSDGGLPYRVWEKPMPVIDPNALQCVFYIYPTLSTAKAGDRIGGTGFFVAREFELYSGRQQLYAVTNRHCVIESGGKLVLRITKTDGASDYLETKAEDWTQHPDLCDVAVLPIDLPAPEQYAYNFVSLVPFFLTPTTVSDRSIGPGDDIFMLGRFIGQDGKQRNLPTVRSGIVSRMNGEPIPDQYGINQDSFLVEMRSLSGYSGSPVFVQIAPGLPRPPHFMTSRRPQSYSHFYHGPWLLGIDWCHISNLAPIMKLNDQGRRVAVEPKQWADANTGMAGVIPAWRIQEIIELPELVMQREKTANEMISLNNHQGVAVSDFQSVTDEEPTQTTDAGLEIPIPTEKQFFDDLNKATRKKD
jgi:hypothetical protein